MRDIPPSKLVVGMPWYGYMYRCMNLTDEGICSLADCKNNPPAYQSDMNSVYHEYIKNESYYTVEKGWDDVTLTPFLTIKTKNSTKEEIQQFWYDDGYSLKKKSSIYKIYDIRGVAAFQADCTNYTTPELQGFTQQLWDFFTLFD